MRIVLALRASLALTLLMGCDPSANPQRPRIGVVLAATSDPFFALINEAANNEADELSVDLVARSPATGAVAEQVALIDELVDAQVSALVVSPLDPMLLINPLSRPYQGGIPVLTVGRALAAEFPFVHIGSNYEAGGRIACERLARVMVGRGAVYIQNQATGDLRFDAEERGCRTLLRDNYPQIMVVARDDNGGTVALATQQTLAALTANPTISGVFATTEAGALGVAEAIRSTGRLGQLHAVSIEATLATVGALLGQALDACVAEKPRTMGKLSIGLALLSLDQPAELPKVLDTGFVVIDRTNVGDIQVGRYVL